MREHHLPRLVATSLVPFSLLVVSGDAREATPDGDGEPRAANILWVIGEDMGPDLGCYGTPEVSPPHLDRLAAQGARDTYAYTTAPVCPSSRSAFCTGMYQTSIDAHNRRSHRGDGFGLARGVRVITDWLRDAGCFTVNVGRLSRPISGTGKTDWNFAYNGPYEKPFDSSVWPI